MRSARGDVRDHIFYPKTTMDLRIGPSGRCSGQVIETSAFARFSEMFDFGLLQQYLPEAEVKQTQSTLAGYRNFENMTRLSPLDLARASRSFGLAHDFSSQSMERKSLSALYYCSDFGTFNIDCRSPCGLRFVISFFRTTLLAGICLGGRGPKTKKE